MRICWYQPTHGAYLHLVTEPFSRQLLNCGTFFRQRSETFRVLHLLRELSKIAFNWLIVILSFLIRIWKYMYMRNISFLFIIIDSKAITHDRQTQVAKLATFVASLVTHIFSTCHGNQNGDSLEYWTTHIVYYCKIMFYWNLIIKFALQRNAN